MIHTFRRNPALLVLAASMWGGFACAVSTADSENPVPAIALLAIAADPLCWNAPSSNLAVTPTAGTSGFSASSIRLGARREARSAGRTVFVTSGAIVENRVFTNPDGICLVLAGASNVVVRGNHFINCKQAVELLASPEAPLRNVIIRDNLIEKVNSGIILKWIGSGDNARSNTRNVQIHNNRFENITAPADPKERLGGAIGFQYIRGCGIAVTNNSIINEAGKSSPSDLINLYLSAGKPGDPINIEYNLMRGGRIPSAYHDESSGGIVLGDGCHPQSDGPGCVRRPEVFSQYQRAANNVLIDPGKNGLGIAGGRHILVEDNIIYGTKHKHLALIGLAHYDTRNHFCQGYGYDFPGCVPYDPERPTCRGLVVRNNRVNYWTNGCTFNLNPDGTCGPSNSNWEHGTQVRSWPNATDPQAILYCGIIEGVDPNAAAGPLETNHFDDSTIDPNDYPN